MPKLRMGSHYDLRGKTSTRANHYLADDAGRPHHDTAGHAPPRPGTPSPAEVARRRARAKRAKRARRHNR
jgi:hypothetical protein